MTEGSASQSLHRLRVSVCHLVVRFDIHGLLQSQSMFFVRKVLTCSKGWRKTMRRLRDFARRHLGVAVVLNGWKWSDKDRMGL